MQEVHLSAGVSPAQLHEALKEAPAITIQFGRVWQLQQYRRQIYQQNSHSAEVHGRYRTMREGLQLTIIRIA